MLVGLFTGLASQDVIYNWYLHLNKPSFNPPNWLFTPVWIILYVLMGVAAGLIWSKGFYHKWVKTALYHFVFQLLLNASWSIVFFGFKAPFWALIVVTTLFILILFTIKWFRVIDKKAGYLLYPYALWVGFATVLNFMIWKLN